MKRIKLLLYFLKMATWQLDFAKWLYELYMTQGNSSMVKNKEHITLTITKKGG